MGEDEININFKALGNGMKNISKFLNQKKVIYSIVAVLFLLILFMGSSIRVQNLPILKDSTTGEYIPIALDPFYFLRAAETIIEKGYLPEFDSMRNIPIEVKFTDEILPYALVYMYKTANIFGNYDIRFIDVIYPVVFFALGLIVFFFLI